VPRRPSGRCKSVLLGRQDAAHEKNPVFEDAYKEAGYTQSPKWLCNATSAQCSNGRATLRWVCTLKWLCGAHSPSGRATQPAAPCTNGRARQPVDNQDFNYAHPTISRGGAINQLAQYQWFTKHVLYDQGNVTPSWAALRPRQCNTGQSWSAARATQRPSRAAMDFRNIEVNLPAKTAKRG